MMARHFTEPHQLRNTEMSTTAQALGDEAQRAQFASVAGTRGTRETGRGERGAVERHTNDEHRREGRIPHRGRCRNAFALARRDELRPRLAPHGRAAFPQRVGLAEYCNSTSPIPEVVQNLGECIADRDTRSG